MKPERSVSSEPDAQPGSEAAPAPEAEPATVQLPVTEPVPAAESAPEAEPVAEPVAEFAAEPVAAAPPRRRRWPWAMAAAVALVLVAVGTATAVVAADDVPRGTTVLGVDIGGRSRAEAVDALTAGLAERLREPVTVDLADTSLELTPGELGLALDAEATVDRAADGFPNPLRVFGTRAVDPVITVDGARAAAALTAKVGRPMKPGTITYSGLTPKPTYPQPGQGVSADAAATALAAGWLRGDRIAVPVGELVPETSREELDQLVASVAQPAVAAPVTVTVPDGKFTVKPAAIARSLRFPANEKGAVAPDVDPAELRKGLVKELAEVEQPPADAKVGDKVVASTGGLVVDLDRLADDLLKVLPDTGSRAVNGVLTPVPPKNPAQDLTKRGIAAEISTFTTYFKGGEVRNHNIIQVAKEVDGAIVEPGATFSLNGFTGPRGYAEGYRDAPVIQGGKLVNHVGGGISQFTTTLFNAVYYAGLEDVFHKPHSYHFSRYPAVIESTIFYPDLDMKFRNDSGHAILIDTSWTDRSITVSIWGTKRYDISTVYGPRTNVEGPRTVRLTSKDCIATDGTTGFSQEAYRVFKQGGKEVRRERFFWDYEAEPRFVCDRSGPTPSATPGGPPEDR